MYINVIQQHRNTQKPVWKYQYIQTDRQTNKAYIDTIKEKYKPVEC